LHYACLPAFECPITWPPLPCGRLSRPPWSGVTPTTTTGPPSPIGLASRRRSHVRPCCTKQRDLGVPLISFNALTGHRSLLRRLRPLYSSRAAEPAPVSDVFPVDANFHLLEIGLQAIQPSPYHAGPSQHRPIRLDAACGFLACSCPLSLSGPGQPSDPRTSLRVPPGYAGNATRRLVAHNARSILPRPSGRPGRLWISPIPRTAHARNS
jgi:hypothetical protein